MFDDIKIDVVAGTSTDNGLDPDDPGYEKKFDIVAFRSIRVTKMDMTEVSDGVRRQLHKQLDKALDDIDRDLARH